MLDINLAISEEIERHNKALDTIRKCVGFEEVVSRVSETDVWCFGVKLFSECKETLSMFSRKHGKYKVSSYYMSGSVTLAIVYTFDSGFDLVFLCSDVDTALKALGNGKCRIVEKTETRKSIVCDLEGGEG